MSSYDSVSVFGTPRKEVVTSSDGDSPVFTGRIGRALILVTLLAFALFYLLPIFIMLANSLKPLAEITGGHMVALPKT